MSPVSRWLFRTWSWAVFGAAVLSHRKRLLYDGLMTRFWPYDRYPGEWKDLLSRIKKENMSFIDYIDIDELHLGSRITMQADDGAYVSGRVVALKLLDDEEPVNGRLRHRVTLELRNGSTLMFDRNPDDKVTVDWAAA